MKDFIEQQNRLRKICNNCFKQHVNAYGDTFCPFIDEYCIDITEEQMKSLVFCPIHSINPE